MSTTVYMDYYAAYDDKSLTIDDGDFNVKLVVDGYEPLQGHKPADVEKYVLNGVSILVGDAITTMSMGSILERVKDALVRALENFPEEIMAEVRKVILDTTQQQNIEQALMDVSPDRRFQLWETLRDNGIKFFVVEYPALGILCFTEPI